MVLPDDFFPDISPSRSVLSRDLAAIFAQSFISIDKVEFMLVNQQLPRLLKIRGKTFEEKHGIPLVKAITGLITRDFQDFLREFVEEDNPWKFKRFEQGKRTRYTVLELKDIFRKIRIRFRPLLYFNVFLWLNPDRLTKLQKGWNWFDSRDTANHFPETVELAIAELKGVLDRFEDWLARRKVDPQKAEAADFYLAKLRTSIAQVSWQTMRLDASVDVKTGAIDREQFRRLSRALDYVRLNDTRYKSALYGNNYDFLQVRGEKLPEFTNYSREGRLVEKEKELNKRNAWLNRHARSGADLKESRYTRQALHEMGKRKQKDITRFEVKLEKESIKETLAGGTGSKVAGLLKKEENGKLRELLASRPANMLSVLSLCRNREPLRELITSNYLEVLFATVPDVELLKSDQFVKDMNGGRKLTCFELLEYLDGEPLKAVEVSRVVEDLKAKGKNVCAKTVKRRAEVLEEYGLVSRGKGKITKMEVLEKVMERRRANKERRREGKITGTA